MLGPVSRPAVREMRMANEEFLKALGSSREIELAVTGRRSGGEISFPVWFVREGEKLYLVPVNGSDSDWYKNVLKTPTIRLADRGAQLTARAVPVADPAEVSEIIDKFRARYGARDVAAYYPKQNAALEVPLVLRLGPEFVGAGYVGSELVGAGHLGSEFVGTRYVGSEFVGAGYVGSELVGAARLVTEQIRATRFVVTSGVGCHLDLLRRCPLRL
jgi:deazaflavin-dependent oxidoreductase (nitroreductase family)